MKVKWTQNTQFEINTYLHLCYIVLYLNKFSVLCMKIIAHKKQWYFWN